jgi:hypothetical protein
VFFAPSRVWRKTKWNARNVPLAERSPQLDFYILEVGHRSVDKCIREKDGKYKHVPLGESTFGISALIIHINVQNTQDYTMVCQKNMANTKMLFFNIQTQGNY